MDANVTSRLDRLLRPRSVAIVGVSPEPGHMGGSVLANLERCRYAGAIHLVSRSRAEFNGRPCIPSIGDLPHGVDIAVLVVPQTAVTDAIAALGRRGVGTAIVFASGYAEVGEAGRVDLERCRYAGAIHLVSRSRAEFNGRPCIPSIGDLPHGVDIAVLVVPQTAVTDAIAALGRRGVGTAIVFASGYAEVGEAGRVDQE